MALIQYYSLNQNPVLTKVDQNDIKKLWGRRQSHTIQDAEKSISKNPQ